MLSQLSPAIRQYLVVTGNYWAFTLTDGALRMLVVLHFHSLGYTPLSIALLFLFYEVFGVVTNLVGGWLGARIGLNRTMNIGLGLQVAALRSEEHTSELQSRPHLVCRLLRYLLRLSRSTLFPYTTLFRSALRMLVVLHFHSLGYTPLHIALLFLFYELFGVVTNLVGGWLGARIGLNRTMNIGLGLQVAALAMLLVPASWLTVLWVMVAQALSGIAKDLNKMSAKSSIKLLVPSDAQGRLYQWVATLTGSKNALKGVGFFLGGTLLMLLGFKLAIGVMAMALALVWLLSLVLLKDDLGRSEEHTSELQSRPHLVCRLLLEKKKNKLKQN